MPFGLATRDVVRESSTPSQWIVAVLFFVLAVTTRFILEPIIPGRLPFITFYPILVLSVLFTGFWPSVTILFASAMAGVLFWDANALPAIANLLLFRVVGVSLFIVGGLAIIFPLMFAMKFAQQIKTHKEQLELINQELIHRIKNLSSVMNAICSQTIRSKIPREELSQVIAGRIQAVAMAERLSVAVDGANLRELIRCVVEPLAPPECLFIEGPEVNIPKQYATPFALVLHELATNALKHGAWRAVEAGMVVIRWHLMNHDLAFHWEENHVVAESLIKSAGLGSLLITKALSHAKVRHVITAKGALCQIELKL